MKKCWAFYPIAGTRLAWIPCVRTAKEGSRFCRRHGDAIAGALLGAAVHAEAVDEAVKLEDEPVPEWMKRKKKENTTSRQVAGVTTKGSTPAQTKCGALQPGDKSKPAPLTPKGAAPEEKRQKNLGIVVQ